MFQVVDFILNFDQHLGFFVQNYGVLVYGILFLIVFIETGLVVMPFLPGDSMLFIAGTFAAAGLLDIRLLIAILFIAAVIGDASNYWIGKFFGEKVFMKFIKPAHIDKTKVFYEKHGKKTIVIARFVPIVRTIAPFVAGVGKMEYSTFLAYNLVGGFLWVFAFVLGGYLFGNIPWVKENVTLISLLIIAVSLIPVFVSWISGRRKKWSDG